MDQKKAADMWVTAQCCLLFSAILKDLPHSSLLLLCASYLDGARVIYRRLGLDQGAVDESVVAVSHQTANTFPPDDRPRLIESFDQLLKECT